MTTQYKSSLLLIVSWFIPVDCMVNLNKGMVTSSSPAHDPYFSPNAVDGLYGSNPLTNCFVSANSQISTAWWRGDIGFVARIINIDIQFREGTGRQNGYFLYVSNSTSWKSGRLCYHDDDPDVIPDVIQNKTCELDGRYVMVVIHSDSTPFVEICEIDVYGCRSNFYGEKCEFPCYCKQGCNVTTGICDTPECQPGWQGIRCDSKCGPHLFGSNCSKVCHCRESGCHHITGHCDKPTCLPGYHGDSCDQECATGTFGDKCSKGCHCKTSGCSHVTGICKTPGCSRGWNGTTCSEACGLGTFGEDCNRTCHCLITGCNPFIGSCYEPGCEQGWSGDSCEVKSKGNESSSDVCEFGKFGSTCSKHCHCDVGGCDHVTGTCEKPGCKPGWRGAACDQRCRSNFYGEKCEFPCNCQQGCNVTTGICDTPECQPGWQGIRCDTICAAGTFGHNCNNTCHCLYPGCDHVNGTCYRKEVVCQDGWTGDSCDTACPAGFFGTRCSKLCQCKFPGCHHVTGACDDKEAGCLDGWKGDACDKAEDSVHACVDTCPNTQDLLTAIHDSVQVCPNTQDLNTAILFCVLFGILVSVTGNAITMMLIVRRSCCKKRQDLYTIEGGIVNKTYDDLNLPNNEEIACSVT